MIFGDKLNISKYTLNAFEDNMGIPNLHATKHFRNKCIKAGYYILEVFPVYYQGWELDEWGAIAIKDGRRYTLTTDHGRLVAEEAKKNFLQKLLGYFHD